jgi:hypothetical protein
MKANKESSEIVKLSRSVKLRLFAIHTKEWNCVSRGHGLQGGEQLVDYVKSAQGPRKQSRTCRFGRTLDERLVHAENRLLVDAALAPATPRGKPRDRRPAAVKMRRISGQVSGGAVVPAEGEHMSRQLRAPKK